MSVVPEELADLQPLTVETLRTAWNTVVESLRGEQLSSGQWTGQLSTSALSTATAISAIAVMVESDQVPKEQRALVMQAIGDGCGWLNSHQNEDGGFGDTDRSYSNIATTLLVLAAWELAARLDRDAAATDDQRQAAWKYVDTMSRWDGLRRRYGKDKTFVVPILSNCALAGLVPWTEVSPLPFEAAALPQEWYRWARMPVVSYAVPALVAIGQARFHKAPPRNVLLKRLRHAAIEPTLKVLRRMQPASGGYLEAVPLTSFVLMNLAAVGNGGLPVAIDCLKFILDSRLADGSWPIDTNLATWATSLSLHGLARRGELAVHQVGRIRLTEPAGVSVSAQTIRWLLSCQHKQKHPFTGANPGGWGWTDLSGAVPDADDTPAALLALRSIDSNSPHWSRLNHQIVAAGQQGVRWLLKLQNRDGGWPTFCKGWGTLPFDRSGTDLTAHAIRALAAWNQSVPTRIQSQIRRAVERGFRYLERRQQDDGSWLPLWFGNQDRPDEDNPVYGTGKVLLAYAALGRLSVPSAERAMEYLRSSQNEDGGWGGGLSVQRMRQGERRGQGEYWASTSTVEESAVALEGLLECGGHPMSDATIMRGLSWLSGAVAQGGLERALPIGFYFAKLWYYERLYPTVFSLGALGSALRKLERDGN